MLLPTVRVFATVSYWQKRARGVTQLISPADMANGLLHRNSCSRNCLATQFADCTPQQALVGMDKVVFYLASVPGKGWSPLRKRLFLYGLNFK